VFLSIINNCNFRHGGNLGIFPQMRLQRKHIISFLLEAQQQEFYSNRTALEVVS